MKKIGSCSFEISNKNFPILKFSSYKQGREENISAINKEKLLKTAKLLNDNGEYEDELLFILCGLWHQGQLKWLH